MDAVLGIAIGPSTARMALIEGARADGIVIDEAVLEIPAPRIDGGAAEVIDTIVGTQRALANAGHRLVAAGICALGGFASPALREAMQRHGVQDVVLISEAQADEALSNRRALNVPHREVAAARGAALAASRGMYAGPPTIFRSALVRPVAPTHVGASAHADIAPTRSVHVDIAHAQLGPSANPRTGPFESPRTGPFPANTRLTPTAPPPPPPPPAAAARQLAYSMTGHIAAVTDYVEEYESGPNDHYAAQVPDDIAPDAADPDLDDAPEPVEERPAKKPFLLIGSVAAVFMAIAISILTTSVVISVTPTAHEKPVTSSQQPVLAPLATRITPPPVATPVPPPPVVAPPPPPPPVVQRQAPPRVTETAPEEDTPPPRVTETQPRSRFTPSSAPDDEDPPPPDDYDDPSPREAPPHRDPFTPYGPPPHGGGLFPVRHGCLPLLPC
jgi:hypothetical protein